MTVADLPQATIDESVLAVRILTRDFVAWVASSPRTYSETMEAWRTSCPRFPIWENALRDGLVLLENVDGRGMSQTRVMLSPRGLALLREP